MLVSVSYSVQMVLILHKGWRLMISRSENMTVNYRLPLPYSMPIIPVTRKSPSTGPPVLNIIARRYLWKDHIQALALRKWDRLMLKAGSVLSPIIIHLSLIHISEP